MPGGTGIVCDTFGANGQQSGCVNATSGLSVPDPPLPAKPPPPAVAPTPAPQGGQVRPPSGFIRCTADALFMRSVPSRWRSIPPLTLIQTPPWSSAHVMQELHEACSRDAGFAALPFALQQRCRCDAWGLRLTRFLRSNGSCPARSALSATSSARMVCR